jgi:antitoxin HigA-1
MDRFNLPTHRPPTHPGEMLLEEFLNPLGITQKDFANRIGVSYIRLNEIVRGRRGVTPDTALRLERATRMGADFWIDLQTRWDLWHAMRAPAAKDIDKIISIDSKPADRVAGNRGLPARSAASRSSRSTPSSITGRKGNPSSKK